MDSVIAIKFNDFVLFSASGTAAHYIIKITDTEDRMTPLGTHKLMAIAGENADRDSFAHYISRNLALNTIRSNGLEPDTPAVAAWVRSELAKALRSRGAYEIFPLLGGYDRPVSEHDDTPAGTHLFLLDYLGTLQAVPYAAHGYAAAFVLATLDAHYRPDMSPADGAALLQLCVDEVKRRLIIANPHFISRAVTREGIETVNVH